MALKTGVSRLLCVSQPLKLDIPQTHPSLSQPLWPSKIYQIQLGGDVLGVRQSPWTSLWMIETFCSVSNLMQEKACLSTETRVNNVSSHKGGWNHTSMCTVKIQWDLEECLFKAWDPTMRFISPWVRKETASTFNLFIHKVVEITKLLG